MNSAIRKQQVTQNLIALLFAGGLFLFTLGVASRFFGRFALLFLIVVGLLSVWSFRRNRAGLPRNVEPISPRAEPNLYRMVEHLARRAGIGKTPRVYRLAAPEINAATLWSGPEPVLVVTPALLYGLSPRELFAVLAHEIAHIKNGDFAVFHFAGVLRHVTSVIAQAAWILSLFFLPILLFTGSAPFGGMALLLIAPIVSVALQMALLRSREFSADLGAAEITGDPGALAAAPKRIDRSSYSVWSQLSPLGRRGGTNIFTSHPATEQRVRRLLALAEPGTTGWSSGRLAKAIPRG